MPVPMQAVPSLQFDTDDLPPQQRFAAWASALKEYDVALPAPARPEDFQTRVTAWFLGDLVFTRASLPAVHWRRSPERIAADGADIYNFVLITRGSFAGASAARPILIGAGQIGCFDLSQPYEGDGTPTDSLVVTVARPALDRLLRFEPDLHGRVFAGAAGTLLIDYLLALERQLPHLGQNDVPILARASLGQFAAAIEMSQGTARATARLDGLRHRARRQIERHLTDREFSPRRLADDLGVTRAALYRSFAPLGGVAAYLRRRRLEAVRVLLSDTDERRSIAELAQTFGFADAAHFSRAFREAYDTTPRAHRQHAEDLTRPRAGPSEPPELFEAWIKRLQGRAL